MSSQTATHQRPEEYRPDVQCRATPAPGSRATGRFEKDARMDLELIACARLAAAEASLMCLVIIIAASGFLILASVLTAVEPCRSSCRFGNAAGHRHYRLLQSSAELSATLPWRTESEAEVSGRLARPVKRLNGCRAASRRWHDGSRYQRKQWLLVTAQR
jgi:hypothetical protein